MSAVLKFPTPPQMLAPASVGPQISGEALRAAEARLAMIRPALDRILKGASVRAAAMWLAGTGDKQLPSQTTLGRWLRDYMAGGVAALAPKYKGRVRLDYGWELKAQQLYAQPTRPSYSTVAYWLRQDGHSTALEHRVRRYLQSLPSNLTETSPNRLGKHFYAQNIKPYVIRDTSELPVGMVYEGDGHCCDVYVAQPNTGNPWRPELTIWLDITSQYVVGWWLSESESAQTTLFSLSHALVTNDHVPGFVHSDPGSGFKARMIIDGTSGFLSRFSIQSMLALPGNARGKGLTEGWFRWFEERCGKRFPTFCGHCRTDDALSRLRQRINKGEIQLPSFYEYAEAVRDYITAYNNTPKEGLGNRAPAELWAQLERVPLHMSADAVVRPRVARKVSHWGVSLHNRLYRGDLRAYESREVLVEYCLHDDARVWIHDLSGRYIGEAVLVDKKAWLPASRVEEQKIKRLDGQRKRLQRDMDEASARARTPLSINAMFDALDGQTQLPDVPSAPPVTLEHMRAIDEDFDQQPEHETPDQRFARYLQLLQARRTDQPISAADAQWMEVYPTTSECSGRMLMHEEFEQ